MRSKLKRNKKGNNFMEKAIIEIPMGSRHKYEIDKGTGELVLDRVLNVSYPFNYGFIPETLCDDGDPLDVFVVSNQPIPPLTKVRIKILGVIKGIDNGKQDDKIIAGIEGDDFAEMAQMIGENIPDQISYFLNTYKNGFNVLGLGNSEEAENILNQAIYNFHKNLKMIS